ncbi:hypothetical protein D9613_009094 [Agrocybe pediades]|uniref:Antifreeze protein n=1 Tax=Agrocybe pediades TaxID=84607 RepID=A0A8H4R4N0_9AGAR|nr:hypothetical protein D9613_009094 [Agrocybe pediades]
MIFGTAFFAILAAATASAVHAAAITTLASEAQMMHFLNTTDAELKFIGKPIDVTSGMAAGKNSLARRDGLPNTMVIYCTAHVDQICGGTCTVYNGGPTCINAPGTACLMATNNVGFCDKGACGGSCNQFASCGDRLDNGFCSTPGTSSIVVSA